MVAIITQARVNSNRLPNKIFLEANHHPFLHYHIERLKKTGLSIVVATTNDGSEKPIVEFCKVNHLSCFCGDEQNVLKRFYECAKEYKLNTIIRVTSDCPLIDGNIIANGLTAYRQFDDVTYYSNTIERTYPRGMDYEIFSFGLLEDAFKNATDDSDKEHVSPYIWKNRSGKVNIKHDIAAEDNSNFRITLDTIEDQILITKLIEEHNASELDCNAIVNILKNKPGLSDINALIEQKKV
jgi:spore coat polysaccharide biosynthesis protein SpsF